MVSGWVKINDADEDDLELAVEDWHFFNKTKPEIDDLPADARVGFDLGYRKRTLLLKGVRFDSLASAKLCIKLLDEWNLEDPFTIDIKVESGGSIFHQDGLEASLKYLYLEMSEIKKMAGGSIQQYRIARILFKQAG